jgi:hypothetical protein
VRRDRTRIEDLHVTDRWDLFELFGFRRHSGEVTEQVLSVRARA